MMKITIIYFLFVVRVLDIAACMTMAYHSTGSANHVILLYRYLFYSPKYKCSPKAGFWSHLVVVEFMKAQK